MKLSSIILAALICLLPDYILAQERSAAPSLRVLSSNGVRAPLEDAQKEIEAAIGYSLDIEFSTSASLTDRIEAGESFDVAILTPALIERLIAGGHVAAESTMAFARTGVGVGAASSRTERDVSTPDALRRTLLAAESVTLTADGQSRRVSEAAFESLGITEQMNPKTKLVGPGEGPFVVARGEAELVLTLISEILPVPGVELIGPFPDELQSYVVFTAGVSSADAAARDAGNQLVEQLRHAPMSRALLAHGLETLDP